MKTMRDFLLFMVFSSLEFFSLLLLTMSVFSFRIQDYKYEILIASLLITLLSFALIKLNISSYIVFIQIPAIIVMLKYLFKQKWIYSLIVGTFGYFVFVAIQLSIASLAMYSNFLEVSDINSAFSSKTYTMQIVDVIICCSIGIYIRIIKGGFGFTFRSKKRKTTLFVGVAITSIVLLALCAYSLTVEGTSNYFIISFITVLVITLVLLFLSIKREKVEFLD